MSRRIFILLFLFCFGINVFALDFAPPGAKSGGAVNKPTPVLNSNRAVMPNGVQVINLPDKSKKPIKGFMDNRIEVPYKDYPVSVEVSGTGVNIIKLPYRIKYIDTSGSPEQIGKGEYEFTVSLIDDNPLDLAIITEKKSFLVTLVPVAKPSTVVVIKDVKQKAEKACKVEQGYDYVDLMGYLIASAVSKGEIDGYILIAKNDTFKYQGLPVKLTREYRGAAYSVFVLELTNILPDVLQVSDDSKAVLEILKQAVGRPSAIYVSDEFVKPYKKVQIFAVVPESKIKQTLKRPVE